MLKLKHDYGRKKREVCWSMTKARLLGGVNSRVFADMDRLSRVELEYCPPDQYEKLSCQYLKVECVL